MCKHIPEAYLIICTSRFTNSMQRCKQLQIYARRAHAICLNHVFHTDLNICMARRVSQSVKSMLGLTHSVVSENGGENYCICLRACLWMVLWTQTRQRLVFWAYLWLPQQVQSSNSICIHNEKNTQKEMLWLLLMVCMKTLLVAWCFYSHE